MALLAPNPRIQIIDANGNPVAGGKIYTYLAGTTTPVATYTDYTQNTTNTNPVILDAAGRASIWISDSVQYKFVVNDANDVLLYTTDNINTPPLDWALLNSAAGSSYVGYTQGSAQAVTRTAQAKMRDILSVRDFGAVGDNITDDTTAIQNAINIAAITGKTVFFPAGTYIITTLTLPTQGGGIELLGESNCGVNDLTNQTFRGSVLVSTASSGNVISCNGGGAYNNRGIRIRNLSMRVVTSDYAISLVRAPEGSVLDNLYVYNANAFGGSGFELTSCWSGMQVNNCHVKAATKLAGRYGLRIVNELVAGGYLISGSGFTGFGTGIFLGKFLYMVNLINSTAEQNIYGLVADNECQFTANRCHFEFNTDVAIQLNACDATRIEGCSFYSNCTAPSGIAADIHVNASASQFVYNVSIENCDHQFLVSNSYAVYIANSVYSSGVIQNNQISASVGQGTMGTGVTGLYVGGSEPKNWYVRSNRFLNAATPFNPAYTVGYEIGSWTPVLTATGGVTGQTYTIQQGWYKLEDFVVTGYGYVQLSAEGTMSGFALLGSLPYPVANDLEVGGGEIITFSGLGQNVNYLGLQANLNASTMAFVGTTAAAANVSSFTAQTLYTDTTLMRVKFSYRVA